MQMKDIRNELHDERILSVISHSMFKPSTETLRMLADRCACDPAVSAFACEEHGIILGAIILKNTNDLAFEILHIATAPAHRRTGVASGLISHAIATLKCAVLTAETDEEAVAFYRKYGFQAVSLGEKYPGTIRYRCVWKPV